MCHWYPLEIIKCPVKPCIHRRFRRNQDAIGQAGCVNNRDGPETDHMNAIFLLNRNKLHISAMSVAISYAACVNSTLRLIWHWILHTGTLNFHVLPLSAFKGIRYTSITLYWRPGKYIWANTNCYWGTLCVMNPFSAFSRLINVSYGSWHYLSGR